jgi:hypothetical protein
VIYNADNPSKHAKNNSGEIVKILQENYTESTSAFSLSGLNTKVDL